MDDKLIKRLTESLEKTNLEEKLKFKRGEWGIVIADFEDINSHQDYLTKVLAELIEKHNIDISCYGIDKIYFNLHCHLCVDMVWDEEDDFGII